MNQTFPEFKPGQPVSAGALDAIRKEVQRQSMFGRQVAQGVVSNGAGTFIRSGNVRPFLFVGKASADIAKGSAGAVIRYTPAPLVEDFGETEIEDVVFALTGAIAEDSWVIYGEIGGFYFALTAECIEL